MKVGVWQSNYIPWKGYFDYINSVDIFCFYDEVQYTKNDWRNRNQLLNNNGLFWVTIPVDNFYIKHKISEVNIKNNILIKHFNSIQQCYSRAPFKNQILDLISPYFLDENQNNLSNLNQILIKTISNYIGIKTKFKNSKDFELKDTRIDRLLYLNEQLNATTYISGPNAKNYLEGNEELFYNKGIKIEYISYGPYLKYNRGNSLLFTDQVSIIDLLMYVPQEELLKYITSQKI